MKTIIRTILSLALLYGISLETGVWTTVAMGLIMISVEIIGFNLRVLNEHAKGATNE